MLNEDPRQGSEFAPTLLDDCGLSLLEPQAWSDSKSEDPLLGFDEGSGRDVGKSFSRRAEVDLLGHLVAAQEGSGDVEGASDPLLASCNAHSEVQT